MRLTVLAQLGRASRSPLYRNASALFFSGLLTSGLGIVYWAIAARIYPPSDVGIGASLVSTLMFIGSASQLNLRSAMYRFLPRAGGRSTLLVGATYLFIVLASAILGAGFLIVAALANALPDGASLTVVGFAVFIASTVVWSLVVYQDHVLAGLRLTLWVPVENGAFALLKIGLLPILLGLHPFGVFLSWVIAAAVSVSVVSGLIFAVLLRRRSVVTGDPITVASVARYASADYLAGIFSTAGHSLLPVVVYFLLGSTASAHFYIVWLIATTLQLAPSAIHTSLLVETAGHHATFGRDGRQVLGLLLALIALPVILLVMAAPLILSLFGAEYATGGALSMRLLALSVIPLCLNSFAAYYARSTARMRLLIVIEAATAIPSLGLAVLLIPVLGLAGVALAVLVSQTTVAAVLGLTLLRPVLAPTRHLAAPGS